MIKILTNRKDRRLRNKYIYLGIGQNWRNCNWYIDDSGNLELMDTVGLLSAGDIAGSIVDDVFLQADV